MRKVNALKFPDFR